MQQNRGVGGRYYEDDAPPPGPSEGRIVAPGPMASAGSSADRRAMHDRVRGLADRVAAFQGSCDDLRTRLSEAERRQGGIEEHRRGWPLMVVVALGLVTIALEYVPASLFTQVFMSADDRLRTILTWTFTVIGVLLAVFFGELLHRLRRPERAHVRDTIFVAITAFVILMYLYIGFKLRLAYTETAGTAVNLTAPIEAFALTSVAFIGILLTVVSAYYRESIESFFLGMRVARLRRELAESETHLRTHERDLTRACSAAGIDYDRVTTVERPQPEAAPG